MTDENYGILEARIKILERIQDKLLDGLVEARQAKHTADIALERVAAMIRVDSTPPQDPMDEIEAPNNNADSVRMQVAKAMDSKTEGRPTLSKVDVTNLIASAGEDDPSLLLDDEYESNN